MSRCLGVVCHLAGRWSSLCSDVFGAGVFCGMLSVVVRPCVWCHQSSNLLSLWREGQGYGPMVYVVNPVPPRAFEHSAESLFSVSSTESFSLLREDRLGQTFLEKKKIDKFGLDLFFFGQSFLDKVFWTKFFGPFF